MQTPIITQDASSNFEAQVSECLEQLASRQPVYRPLATYRFQFNKDFRFPDAIKLIPYLRKLGVNTCYASPILKARAGSMHGYDIIDHGQLNPEIGTEEELDTLVQTLKQHEMGLILDIVPNHMGVGHGTNPWWQDVLRNGQASQYAEFFDIDWDPLKEDLHDKVLLPILGDQYGTVLEARQLKVTFNEGEFRVEYFDKTLPVDPQTYPMIFGAVQGIVPDSDAKRDFLGLLGSFSELPTNSTTDPNLAAKRQRELPNLQQRLARIIGDSAEIKELVDAALERLNGTEGNPRSFDALHALLEKQAYRLAYWRVSAEEINYRRFFDINDLVGLRMEDPRVFNETHKLIRRLLGSGAVAGLRIDHPDGLFNPPQYFTRLQMLYAASQCCGPDPKAPLAENGIEQVVQELFGVRGLQGRLAPLYVLVEKILEPGEDLPSSWPVDGTVGYEFANLSTHLFIERRSKKAFTNIYQRFIDENIDVDRLIYQGEKLIMNSSLSSEVNVLSHMLDEISSLDRHARDFTRKVLRDAIRETIAAFPVYRSYIDERGNISERDRQYIERAISKAKRINGTLPSKVFDFLADTLLLRRRMDAEPVVHGYRNQLYFTLKFQQLTGPVMAKGLEDTVCYVYSRMIAVNEVGGSPKEFGIEADEFHATIGKRAAEWPYAMLATSTHDTKRSEDVRMRLAVLSEFPRLWSTQVNRWKRINKGRKKAIGDGRIVPDSNEEYFLYQTLVGAWPLPGASSPTQGVAGEQAEGTNSSDPQSTFALDEKQRQEFLTRIQQYMTKAVHEAKINLSWVNPNEQYINALMKFIERILSPGSAAKPNMYLRQMEEFIPPIAFFGVLNSVAATLVKLTVPGVPDIYQGQELLDFSLVDPDNRRPVDYELRERTLEAMHKAAPAELCREMLQTWNDGRMKLWVTTQCLNERNKHRELFQQGQYVPLAVAGEAERHVVAFARRHEASFAITAIPRFSYTLMKGSMAAPAAASWGDTRMLVPQELAGRTLRNVLTGEEVRIAENCTLLCSEVFRTFPAALLM